MIAFTSDRDGNFEIYVMDADGTAQTNLTNNPASDAVPAWSPDGTKIAFFSDRDGNREIYVMDADGTNPTRLTSDPALDRMYSIIVSVVVPGPNSLATPSASSRSMSTLFSRTMTGTLPATKPRIR